MMPELTRRRTDDRFETWEIWYGDVQVGTIAQQDWDPNPERSGVWKWSCGFYPLHRDRMFQGRRADLRNGPRRAFDAAWKVFLPKRTEAEFEASRRQKQWTANKYALWDAGYTQQMRRGEIRCAMRRDILTRASHEQTMAHIGHITGRAPLEGVSVFDWQNQAIRELRKTLFIWLIQAVGGGGGGQCCNLSRVIQKVV